MHFMLLHVKFVNGFWEDAKNVDKSNLSDLGLKVIG